MLGQVSFDTFLISSSVWQFTLILQVVWVILLNLLYMNVIIAIISDEIEKCMKIASTLWIFPFACEVLRYESMLKENWLRKKIKRENSSRKKIKSENWLQKWLHKTIKCCTCCMPGSRGRAEEEDSIETDDRVIEKSESEKRRDYYKKLFDNVDNFECNAVARCKDYTKKIQVIMNSKRRKR
ncbi:hypothetical protein GUITHDRAFT_151620 [Guillardia theta CCMP2712]|uniref:Uncharacterized protein n=1 Tax=Guillardia theta (strain CCMP2712) TaxID=905079 RepID=L1JLN9_GUITC|nr:hypothetical protein GUITHDRAFT_151620 [Guillardia theta CCMP2712]EKX49099.1 hypothetical protein GUITHDRAFT_151620 [Guillardia theta CCMP2712]|eukprot:XP_005836079.1 hypothetical protein GUITHDRAFT_151620 [Guillardia theta CCMP2712]